MTIKICTNCKNLTPGVTLGVAGVFFKIVRQLVETQDCHFSLFVDKENVPTYRKLFPNSYSIYDLDEFEKFDLNCFDLELSPHHFQKPLTQRLPKHIICFDFHVFDVGWKYPKNRQIKESLLNNLTSYDFVYTIFPRTETMLKRLMPNQVNTLLLDSPNIFPNDPIKHQNKPSNRTWNEIRVLYPAQLQQHKNHINLFQAIRILNERGVSANLYCPGSTFKSFITKNLKETLNRYKLNSHCHLLGYVNDERLEELYSSVDVIISPSFAEGGAYLFQESLVFNKAFCSSNYEQVRMHVKKMNGHTIYFDPYSPESIAAAIEESFIRRDELQKMNQKAKELISSWSWKTVASRIYQQFLKSLNNV
jgi:glycosyltransferase involved in cell wall biosynthesis